LFAIELSQDLASINLILEIHIDGSCRQYSLCVIIYLAGDHFTACVITCTGMVWFHDGIFTGSSLVY
ncbi:hypothetical protein L208DRAFT_1155592, partial [Tricholoma matsutake]